MEQRNRGLDELRLLCMVMLAVYHVINYYHGQSVNMQINGYRALVVQNLFWGGGRMICNVFLMISAWFLCDKPFRFERIARTWLTVLFYSLACGAVHYAGKRDAAVLMKYLFPVSNAVVWYASAYIAVLMLSPFLNLILHKAGMRGQAVTVCILFAAVSVLPSFYPKSYLQFTNTGWFALLYLVTGLIKQGRLTLKRSHACFLFLAGWIMAIGFYNWYDYAVLHHALAWIFEQLGFYKNMYFAMLSSLPCFLSAAGLFLLFLNRGGKTGISRFHAWGGGKLACASLDVYILSSIAGINGKLFWIELLRLKEPQTAAACYLYALLGIGAGVLCGNVREFFYRKYVRNNHHYKNFCQKIDLYIMQG